jgi:hypothetical protein
MRKGRMRGRGERGRTARVKDERRRRFIRTSTLRNYEQFQDNPKVPQSENAWNQIRFHDSTPHPALSLKGRGRSKGG